LSGHGGVKPARRTNKLLIEVVPQLDQPGRTSLREPAPILGLWSFWAKCGYSDQNRYRALSALSTDDPLVSAAAEQPRGTLSVLEGTRSNPWDRTTPRPWLEALPDETLFSLCSRQDRLWGRASAAASCTALFGRERVGTQHDLPSALGLFENLNGGVFGSSDSFALGRTLLKFYAPFSRALQLEDAATAMTGPTNARCNSVSIPLRRVASARSGGYGAPADGLQDDRTSRSDQPHFISPLATLAPICNATAKPASG
jgi:hypothetical protein